jgi:hypothetical protein
METMFWNPRPALLGTSLAGCGAKFTPRGVLAVAERPESGTSYSQPAQLDVKE